jgi:O-antigen ligase
VAGYGLAEYVVRPPPLDPFEGHLLHRPLGYANALGIYAAIGALLALGLALHARRPGLRAVALAPLAVLVPTLLLTSSRGAWVASAAGLLVLVRPRLGLLTGIAAAAALAVVVAVGGTRLADNRADYWRVAWEDARAHPLRGDGAGTFADYWLAHGPGDSFTRTAHSLYLQSLAELGPLGLLLVVVALGLPLVRLRGTRGPPAAAGAAYVAYVLHTGIDWDWEMPATTVAGLLCGAALLVSTRDGRGRPIGVPARLALAVLVVASGLAAARRIGSGSSSPFS